MPNQNYGSDSSLSQINRGIWREEVQEWYRLPAIVVGIDMSCARSCTLSDDTSFEPCNTLKKLAWMQRRLARSRKSGRICANERQRLRGFISILPMFVVISRKGLVENLQESSRNFQRGLKDQKHDGIREGNS